MEPVEQFAANVQRLRAERGLTQEELADASGLLFVDIAKIETQGREPKVTTIARLAQGLEVEAGELFKDVRVDDTA